MNAALHALSQSELAQRVAWTLAHALWQGLVVALLLAIVLRWLRAASAGTRHAIACVALLTLLAAPVVTFRQLEPTVASIEETAWATAGTTPRENEFQYAAASHAPDAASPIAGAQDHAGIPSLSSAIPWHTWAVVAWLAGMAALTFWHGLAWVQLQRLRREGVADWSDDFAAMAVRLARRLGLRVMPRVLWSRKVGGPVAFGCWRAVVLMPSSLATGFTMEQIEMILAHEFAHLRRHDYLINLCQTAAATVLFFHPAVWWINHVIRREREHACDDLAIAAAGDARRYAHALVSLAEHEMAGAPRLAPAAMQGAGELRRRVERLLHPPSAHAGLRFWPGLVSLGIAVTAWLTLPTQPAVVHGAAPGVDEVALRGDIRDRNGVVLATSDKESVQIWFRLSDVAIAYAEAHDGNFPRRKFEPSQATKQAKEPLPADGREVPDIVAMFNDLIIAKLNAVDLAQPYNATQLRRSYQGEAGLPPVVAPEQARSVLGTYGSNLWLYRSDLTPAEEKRARAIAGQVPGMSIHIEKSRRYPFGALASHVLGYVNGADFNASPAKSNHEYGVYGLEKTQDEVLQPTAAKDGDGPRLGSDVFLTLDARHQTVIEQTLRDAELGRAAAVLMEVDTGDVLAMASVPSYDPNDFVPSISRKAFDNLNTNKAHPMLNRAVRSYAPGTTFCMATTLAAICSGHEDDRYGCTGSVTYDERTFLCWVYKGLDGTGGHHSQDLRQAVTNQCHSYFYQLGNAMTLDDMEKTVRLCGLGAKTGIELEEESGGFFPTREWQQHKKITPFTSGHIANTSIGQGYVEATPLQLARLAATVANGGSVWKPRLVDRIAPAGDAPKAEIQPRVRTANLREHGLTDSGLAALRGGLDDVVNSSWPRARRAQTPVIRIAGATGTVQRWQTADTKVVEYDTWFVCYAPADKPRWALAVLVQGGLTGGGSAAPVARRILEQVSAIEAGTLKVEPRAMAPVKGNFDPVNIPFEKEAK